METSRTTPLEFSTQEQSRLARVLLLPFAACLLFFCFTPFAEVRFQPSQPGTRHQLVQVIEGQLAAFRAGDYAQAYAFASTDLQAQMALDAFEKMVRQGYPAILAWRSAAFGEVLDNGREAIVEVSVRGARDRVRHYRYILLLEQGRWRISGVVEFSRNDQLV